MHALPLTGILIALRKLHHVARPLSQMRGVRWRIDALGQRINSDSPFHTFSFALFRVQPAVSRTLLVPRLPHHGYRSRWYASLTSRSTLGLAVKTNETHRASVIRKLNLKIDGLAGALCDAQQIG